MLPCVVFAHVAELCGEKNFKRRRRQIPYAFFYLVEGLVLFQMLLTSA
jgi:hypothetical protein